MSVCVQGAVTLHEMCEARSALPQHSKLGKLVVSLQTANRAEPNYS